MKIIDIIKSIKNNYQNFVIDKYPLKFNEFLRGKGVTVGSNVKFITPSLSSVDLFAPWLISIGNNVCISKGITILNHDYSSAIFRNINGEVLGYCGEVKIGNNVQIGVDVTLLPGTIIHDNCIIGARSLCKGEYESGFVYAGVPAKKICDINAFLVKRRSLQIKMASELIGGYYKKHGHFPEEEEINSFHFFHLWKSFNDYPELFWHGFGQINNKGKIIEQKKNLPVFEDFETFCNSLHVKK